MAGTVIADNLQAASTSQLVIKNGVASTPPTIQDSAGTQIGTFCRSWVNFNGTGTVAIRASFNVTSITDNGTGDYTVNFTTAMPDVNYATLAHGEATSGTADVGGLSGSKTTSAVRFNCYTTIGTNTDFPIVNVAVFR